MKKHLALILILLIPSILYINSLDNPFTYDDQRSIEENVHLRRIENVTGIFTHPEYYIEIDKPGGGHYRPLLFISFILNYQIGGLDPIGYHMVNLLFHIGSAFLVYLILQAMVGGSKQRSATLLPLAAALIFAVHPFNTEAVNYITARSSVMSGFFYLLAFYFWVKFREAAATSYYIASFTAFLLGLLTKEVVITLPIVLWLYDLYFKDIRHRFRACIQYSPFILLGVTPYLFLRMSLHGSMLPTFKRDLMTQFLTEMPVLVKYLYLFFIPLGLNIDHYVTVYEAPAFPVIASILFLLLLTVIAIWLYLSGGTERRIPSFFMIWFFIVLLPTTIIPLNAIIQENRGYLAGAGLSVIAGIILGNIERLEQMINTRSLRYVIPGLLVIALSLVTLQRNFLWGDQVTLWSDAVRKSPLSARSHVNLGVAYATQDLYRKGERELLRSLELKDPPLFDIHLNLGNIYNKTGRIDLALKEYEKASIMEPDDFRPYYASGVLHQEKGDIDSAIRLYQKVLQLNPWDFRTYHNMGLIFHNRGDLEKAETYYRKALSLNPNYTKSLFNLASIYKVSGEVERAKEAYLYAIKNDPEYVDAYLRLGDLYKDSGDHEKARSLYEQAAEIKRAR